ncbi:carboxypeptidase-like regulatory domain-containing protein [Pararobbsia alpina]|uniref:Carboxypeptidase regulatory-like domain-containing protein n=1 Tax=Pararobbsia alpina TaxID=621374 RepID=A0A6S7BMK1_9BURK|nr:carboxypeptidase-like regulatory domain-containing protein [Pararobbsia alpina]CAB3806166.1 hypothetical protein LMG28138_05771 [Pararobbsia alpina]
MKRLPLALGATLVPASLATAVPLTSAQTTAPPEQLQGVYVSGGIGLDEVAAIKHIAAHYPLALEFARKAVPQNEYMSDVKVAVKDHAGKTVFSATSDGPFLLVKLPAGNYSVSVDRHGEPNSAWWKSSGARTHGCFLCGRSSDAKPLVVRESPCKTAFGSGGTSRGVSAVIFAFAALIGSAQIAVTPVRAAERALALEQNPPGDIPDTQVFLTYTSPLGFSLQVPEGWARTERRDGAKFADKYNTVEVTIAPAAHAPMAGSVADHEAADLLKGGRAVKIETVRQVALRSGPALLIVYTSNSEPNPVTNKQLRLESNRYLIYGGGKLATLDLSAPFGADNADQWKLMSNSFQWR